MVWLSVCRDWPGIYSRQTPNQSGNGNFIKTFMWREFRELFLFGPHVVNRCGYASSILPTQITTLPARTSVSLCSKETGTQKKKKFLPHQILPDKKKSHLLKEEININHQTKHSHRVIIMNSKTYKIMELWHQNPLNEYKCKWCQGQSHKK